MKITWCAHFLFGFLCFLHAGQDGFTISGDGRMRFRYIDANIDEIIGTYGEELKQGFSLKQRLDLFMNVPLLKYIYLDAGARISNEDSKSVLAAPDFIATKVLAAWWSFNIEKEPFMLTFGSYETSFTPLTMMRWDTKDNPLAASGCACQISVGGISGEILEEPFEDYRLEGAKFEAISRLGDLKLVFARPQVASEGEAYAQYLYGARARLIPPFATSILPTIGITALRAKDDVRSVGMALNDPLQSDVVGADIYVPIAWGFAGIGEFARSIRDDNLLNTTDQAKEGNGIIAGLQLLRSDKIDGHVLYLHMDPYFSPLYRALSYAKNRHGFRFSLTLRQLYLLSQPFTISGYLKSLDEIKPTWNEAITEWHQSLSHFVVATCGVMMPLTDNVKAEIDVEYRKTDRTDDASTLASEAIEEQTKIISLLCAYEFTMQTKLIFKYQFIDNRDGVGDNDYRAHMPMIQLAVRF